MMRLLKKLAVDITPLTQSKDFRILWYMLLVMELGISITRVAVYYQVYQLTKSAAAVGLVGLFKLVPLVIGSIGGGGIIDAIDRRKMLLVSQLGFCASASLLFAGALTGSPPLWLIYAAVALGAFFQPFHSPARQAMIANIVDKSQLPSALALNHVAWNTTMLVGPLVGGVVLATLGLQWAYGLDVGAYAFVIMLTLRLRPMPPSKQDGVATTGIAAIKEGFGFLRRHRVIQASFLIDLFAMIFGMPQALFAILGTEFFGGGPRVVGYLFAAPALGAVVAAASAGWVGSIKRQGLVVILSVIVWGLGIAAFGMTRSLPLALFFLAIAGGADVISAVFRSTIMQVSVPDALRGRLYAVYILVVAGGPRLGDVEAGLVAEVFTPTISVISGGLLTLAGVGVVALFYPEFAKYRSDTGGRIETRELPDASAAEI